MERSLSLMLRSESGYTLIELIVVMAMISIIVGISFSSLRFNSLNQDTQTAVSDLRSSLRGAQEDALSSKLSSAGAVADYYGIKLNYSGSVVTGYSIIRIDHCNNLSQATVVGSYTFPKGLTGTTVPPNLSSITFNKNSAATTLYDTSGAQIANNSGTLNADGSVSLTISASGAASKTFKIYPLTGRIE